MGPFEYKITIYEEDEHCAKKYKGVTFADSYTEAMDNIESYYGQSIIDIKIYGLEENSIYEINENNFTEF